MKKSLLTLGTIGAIAAPVAAVISCGEAEGTSAPAIESITKEQVVQQTKAELEYAKTNEATLASTSLSFKVRATDKAMWEAVAAKFNSHHKGTINIDSSVFSEPDLIPALSTAAASNSLTDLSVVDMNAVSYEKQNGSWFEPLQLESIFPAANASAYDSFTGQKSFGIDRIMESHVSINSNTKGAAIAIPLGYGAKGLMINTTMVSDHAAATDVIHSYAPKETSDTSANDVLGYFGLEQVDSATGFPRLATEIEASGDTSAQKIKKNVAYMQRYIQDAGNSHSILNTSAIKTAHHSWLGYGPGNMFQRIYSSAHSLMSQEARNAGSFVMPFKEILSTFSLISSAPIEGLYDNEHKVLTKAGFEAHAVQGGHINPEFAKYLWNSYAGYMQHDSNGNATGFMTSNGINHKAGTDSGEAEPFGYKRTMFEINAPWALGWAERIWDETSVGTDVSGCYKPKNVVFEKNKAVSSGQVNVLGLPYGAIGVADSVAMKKGLSTPKRIVAKRFLKYLFNTEDSERISFDITDKPHFDKVTIGEAVSWNFTSSSKDVQDVQKKAKGPNESGWFKIGQKVDGTTSDVYPASGGVSGTVWKSTDQDFFGVYETNAMTQLQEYYGSTETKTNSTAKWSFNQFKGELDKVASKYAATMALAD